MEQPTTMTIPELITQGIDNSYTYQEYKNLISDLLTENKSTGHEQSEALTNYSMLNDRRMKRWDKTLKIDESISTSFSNADLNVTWVVLTEGWCGDAAHVLPVLNKLAELNDGIDLKIISRDDHDELMNNFLTNGGKSIPKLIVFDNQNKEVLNSWGPRPSVTTQMVNDYKEQHGSLDPEFKQDLQVWYNKDKGANIAEDVLRLL
ncbi:thiol-disulfide isomerase/thioredoxin [Aquimarina sp. EL_43]|uniref:thioredoxin family protein n=1 Tax=unclassified Aquimarina TaxID=2627091 RepID=UPI0018CB1A91|nr:MULTISPECIES: thioredoxin family protein [unclassified Aquimarina]MBG6131930.1 thiol-disulfide isomerase/thioredoxin [Aquimarina sp. EL_35]MBG6149494.1 thiol-disulfide isomerase/thioredoxin [Aquimarina sp. EL_32]MBG6170243.1 thiol-disulfide isomerase/thioredoxin [Aquimarina sp. EL_43]